MIVNKMPLNLSKINIFKISILKKKIGGLPTHSFGSTRL